MSLNIICSSIILNTRCGLRNWGLWKKCCKIANHVGMGYEKLELTLNLNCLYEQGLQIPSDHHQSSSFVCNGFPFYSPNNIRSKLNKIELQCIISNATSSPSQNCPRITFMGSDRTRPCKTLTRPDLRLPTKNLTRPDSTRSTRIMYYENLTTRTKNHRCGTHTSQKNKRHVDHDVTFSFKVKCECQAKDDSWNEFRELKPYETTTKSSR